MGSDIKRYVGCDLGDEFSHLCAVSATGEVEKRLKFATNREAMTKAFSSLGAGKFCVAIEASSHSPWSARVLKGLGHDVLVANARRVKLIYASQDKGDRVDAERLARLARLDPRLLSPIEHRSEDAQNALVPIKMRAQLMQTRTSSINFVRGIAKSFGLRLSKCQSEAFAKRARAQLPEELVGTVEPILSVIAQLTEKIRHIDQSLEQQSELSPAAQALTQISGVGALTAQTFIHTLDNCQRFKRSRDVGAYIGLTPKAGAIRASGSSAAHQQMR